MAYAAALEVTGPPRLALPYGLFSVLSPTSPSDAHWQNGVEWEALSCAPAKGIGDPSCDPEVPTVGLPKEFTDGKGLGAATPFAVYGSFSCSPVGTTPEEAAQQALAHLLAREEARVEQAVWTGDLGNTGFAPGATSLGTGLSIAEGLGALEDWIAKNYGSLGVIHADRRVATGLAAKGEVKAKGSTLYTGLGTPVVAGAGYPGTSPNGTAAAAGTGFIYVTPAMLGYRSEPFPGVEPASAGFDRTSNDLFAVAERTYTIGWDDCGTAVVGITF